MDELIFEPYAVVQRWKLSSPDQPWNEILSEYLLALAKECTRPKVSVVGHIKAMALFQDKSFLRISAIAADRPVTIEGQVPDGLTELELTLNVLVYGLPWTVLQQSTDHVTQKIAERWNVQVNTEFISQPNPPSHHSSHTYHSDPPQPSSKE